MRSIWSILNYHVLTCVGHVWIFLDPSCTIVPEGPPLPCGCNLVIQCPVLRLEANLEEPPLPRSRMFRSIRAAVGPLGPQASPRGRWGPSGPTAPLSRWCMGIDLAILDLGKERGELVQICFQPEYRYNCAKRFFRPWVPENLLSVRTSDFVRSENN